LEATFSAISLPWLKDPLEMAITDISTSSSAQNIGRRYAAHGTTHAHQQSM